MSTETRVWNLRAALAVAAFLIINGVAIAGLFTGKLSFQEYMGAAGTINGVAIGWLFRDMTP